MASATGPGVLWHAALSRVPGGQLAGAELCQRHVLAAQEELSGGGWRAGGFFRVPGGGFLYREGLVVQVRYV